MTIDWGTTIPIIVAFGSATTAQIISHHFSRKREEEKYKKEALQNLYSPVVFQIVEYIQLEYFKAVMEEQPLNPTSVFKKALESMGKNMKYAHPDLIMKYEIVNSEIVNSEFDRSNGEEQENTYLFKVSMDLCGEFLMDFLKNSREIGALSRVVEDKIKYPLFLTQFYLLLDELKCWTLTDALLQEFTLSREIFLRIQNEFLEKILNIRKNINYEFENHFKYKMVDRTLEAYSDGYQFVWEFIEEYSIFHPKEAEYWKSELEKVLNDGIQYKIKIE